MYRVGICDDDKVLCSLLEEQIQGLSAEFSVKFEIEVWYSGESLECDLKKGVGLDILFLDIELLQKNGFKVEMDAREEKLGYRIREGQMEKVPYLLVLGNNERDEKTVTYRKHGQQKQITVPFDEFVTILNQQIKNKE